VPPRTADPKSADPVAPNLKIEGRSLGIEPEISRPEDGARTKSEGQDLTGKTFRKPIEIGDRIADDEVAPLPAAADEFTKGAPEVIEIAVIVEVIFLYVGNNRHRWIEIEKGPGELARLDHEMLARSPGSAHIAQA